MKSQFKNYPILLHINQTDEDVDFDKLESKIRDIKFDGTYWGKSKRREKFPGLLQLDIEVIFTSEDAYIDDLREKLEDLDEISSTEVVCGAYKLL